MSDIGRGYGKAMLARAIEPDRPKGMTLLAAAGNTAAAAPYGSLGLDEFPGGYDIAAHVSF